MWTVERRQRAVLQCTAPRHGSCFKLCDDIVWRRNYSQHLSFLICWPWTDRISLLLCYWTCVMSLLNPSCFPRTLNWVSFETLQLRSIPNLIDSFGNFLHILPPPLIHSIMHLWIESCRSTVTYCKQHRYVKNKIKCNWLTDKKYLPPGEHARRQLRVPADPGGVRRPRGARHAAAREGSQHRGGEWRLEIMIMIMMMTIMQYNA